MTNDIRARVAKGAALLDDKQAHWYERVDLDQLNLEHCERCVLGQLYSHFDYGLVAVDVYFDDAPEYGFDSEPAGARDWAALTAEWRRVIEARRSEAAAR